MGVLNINVGILGHVDSGKTSLVKALSTVLSTASLDKHPQSRERGITLDLGFSAFTVVAPEHIATDKYSHLQFTLVDCPGHASLIRTIIGGAQIMDMMLLVIDATKGMQAQTVECVVIGEAVMARGADVIVVLNKVDLIPEEERESKLLQAREDVEAQLAGTKLSNASFVSCAAAVGGEKTAALALKVAWESKGRGEQEKSRSGKGRGGPGVIRQDVDSSRDHATEPPEMGAGGSSASQSTGGVGPMGSTAFPDVSRQELSTMRVDAVAKELTQRARVPARRASAPLYFAFDHCFSVRGQGTILTGTLLSGEVKVNQLVELPALRVQKRVKSMQMFRKPVSIARAGDRVGICLANLDAKLLERGVVTTPGSTRPISTAVALVRKVPAFSGHCRSGAYCHVSLGHTTAMATATFFGAKELRYEWRALFGDVGGKETTTGMGCKEKGLPLDDLASLPFPWEAEFVQQEHLLGRIRLAGEDSILLAESVDGSGEEGSLQYCHLAFHSPVITPPNSVVLGSRLDTTGSARANPGQLDAAAMTMSETGDGHCRIAFHGRLVASTAGRNGTKSSGDIESQLEFGAEAGQIRLFVEKVKTGLIFRMGAMSPGRAVEVFGKDLFKKETKMAPFVGMLVSTEGGSLGRIESAFGKAGRLKAIFPPGTSVKIGDKLVLKFRKYVRDPSKRMHQSYLRKASKQTPTECTTTAPMETPYSGSSGFDAAVSGGEVLNLRNGVIDSVKTSQDGQDGLLVVIVSGLFSPEEDIRTLAKLGMVVETTAGVCGDLRGPFGKLGKCKVEFARDDSVRAGDRVVAQR